MLLEEEETTWGETQHSTVFGVHSRSYRANEKFDLQKKIFVVLQNRIGQWLHSYEKELLRRKNILGLWKSEICFQECSWNTCGFDFVIDPDYFPCIGENTFHISL